MKNKEMKQIFKNIEIKQYSKAHYYFAKVFYAIVDILKILGFISITLLLLILIVRINKSNVIDEGFTTTNISIFSAIVIMLVSLAVGAFISLINDSNKDLFDVSLKQVILDSKRGFRVKTVIFNMMFIIILYIAFLFENEMTYVFYLGITLIVYSSLVLIDIYKIKSINGDKLYYIYIKDITSHGYKLYRLNKFKNFPNFKSCFNDEVLKDENKNLNYLLYERYILLYLNIAFDNALKKVKFQNLSQLEEKNIIYLIGKLIKQVNNQNDLFLLSSVLKTISDINKRIYEKENYWFLINLNTLILEELIKIQQKKFMIKYNEVVLDELVTHKLYGSNQLSNKGILNDNIDLYLIYKSINSNIFKKINDIYLSPLLDLLKKNNDFKELKELTIKRKEDLVDKSIDVEYKTMTSYMQAMNEKLNLEIKKRKQEKKILAIKIEQLKKEDERLIREIENLS